MKQDPKNISKPVYIIDSSILIAYFNREDGHEPGFSQFAHDMNAGKIKPIILTLLYWEVGNWVSRKHPRRATEIMSAILLCNFQERTPDIETINIAVEIVEKHKNVTFYDASYHALAIREGGIFITGDKKYYRQVQGMGHIELLKDYQS